MNGVSVIICCYNSEERLPETIHHLAKQKVAEDTLWEIILIDNNSSDKTTLIAKNEWEHYHKKISFRVFQEYQQGLMYARLRGVREAAFQYIIFCDDDNWLNENYVQNAFNIMNDNNSVGILGGRNDAFNQSNTFPDWFKNNSGAYAVGKQASVSGEVTYKADIWGAGMVTQKELYLEAFNIVPSLLTDRKGNSLSSCGDSEYCRRVILMNYKLYYDESLQLTHFIPENRLTEEYRNNLFKAFSESRNILYMYYQMIVTRQSSLGKKLYSLGKSIVKLLLTHLKLFNKSTSLNERLIIYFITGMRIIKVSPEAKKIYLFSKLNSKNL